MWKIWVIYVETVYIYREGGVWPMRPRTTIHNNSLKSLGYPLLSLGSDLISLGFWRVVDIVTRPIPHISFCYPYPTTYNIMAYTLLPSVLPLDATTGHLAHCLHSCIHLAYTLLALFLARCLLHARACSILPFNRQCNLRDRKKKSLACTFFVVGRLPL